MQTEQRSVADIKPYDRSPRVNDSTVDIVARSIKEFEPFGGHWGQSHWGHHT